MVARKGTKRVSRAASMREARMQRALHAVERHGLPRAVAVRDLRLDLGVAGAEEADERRLRQNAEGRLHVGQTLGLAEQWT